MSLETGLSDFHHLIYSMFKCTYLKLPPIYSFRNDDKFNTEEFGMELLGKLSLDNENFNSLLNLYAPYKQKTIRGNHKPFISKSLKKEMMKRAHLKNVANRTGLKTDSMAYKQQRNIVVSLNKKAKKAFFSNIQVKTDAKSFWHACKPFLASKSITNTERIMLKENGLVVTEDEKVANIFNEYFTNITKTLDIPSWNHPNIYEQDPITCAVLKYRSHPSIIAIKQSYSSAIFNFENVSPEIVHKHITNLKKGSIDMPLKVLKSTADIITPFLTKCINSSINNNVFPSELKLADIIPVYKKGDTGDKCNYRPISILPTLSKVFERVIFDQISIFFKTRFSKFLCGFRKGFSTQHSLIRLLQRWQNCLDKKGIIGTIIMDLSILIMTFSSQN